MAAQYMTLTEAAARLGIPADDFKRRLKTEWTHVVPMRDGSTLRFRVNQIDELARQLGGASDPELPLGGGADSVEHGSDDFKVAPAAAKSKPADEPLVFDTSDDDIFSLSAEESLPKAGTPKGGDSHDSDVRLEGIGKPLKKKGGDSEAIPTEEISLDLGGPSSAVIKGGSSAKLSAPKSSTKLSAPDSGKKLGKDSGKGLGKAGADSGDSSEFELSLDADSDDFELQLNTDGSDEVDLGSSPVEEAGGQAGRSGINLRDPKDSGVSLEKGRRGDSGKNLSGKNLSGKNLGGKKKEDSGKNLKPKDDSDSDVDFDLSLEVEPDAPVSSSKLSGRSGRLPVTSDSDSEFELTLDDSGEGGSLEAAALESADESKGDIFETDFEIPPMTDESGSEAVALDSDTDLEAADSDDLALDESDVVAEEETGSQVVLLEDEPDAAPTSGRRKKVAVEEDAADVDLDDVGLEDDEPASVSAALRGVKSRHKADDDEDEETVPSAIAKPAPWGVVPALFLFPALLVLVLGGLMGYELLHTMMGYQQPRKPAAPIVRAIAKNLDMELKDQ